MKVTSRHFYTVLAIIGFGFPCFAQEDASLTGVVSIQNSYRRTGTREYVPGASISAKGAMPKNTDQNGIFSLVFSDIPVGTPVRLSVKKEGLEVVNKTDLSDAAVVGRTQPLKIYMCNAGELDARIAEYYNFSVDAYTQGFKEKTTALGKQIDQLQKEVQLGQKKETELRAVRDAYALLEEQYKKALEDANNLAEQFALVNLDDESDLYAMALDTFLHGHVPEAISLLESANLEKRLADNTTNVQKGEKIIQRALESVDQSKKQIEEDVRAAVLLAKMYATQFEITKATAYFELAIRYDSANLNNISDYANFLHDNKEYDKARACLNLVANSDKATPWEKSIASGQLGEIYQETGRFIQALDAYKIAFIGFDSLYRIDLKSEFYKKNLATAYSKLGDLYQLQGQIDTALLYFSRAKGQLEELCYINPKSEFLGYNLAVTFSRLGDLYQSKGEFDTALDYFTESKELFEEICNDNPKSRNPKYGLAISYSKLGMLYQSMGKFDTALICLIKYNNLSDTLCQANPKNENLKNGLALSYEKLGDIYQALGKFDTALVCFVKDLDLSEELNHENPQSEGLKISLANAYVRLGDLYQSLDKLDSAQVYFIKYNNLSELLYLNNSSSESVKYGLAFSYRELGNLYKLQSKFDTALVYLTQGTTLFEAIYRDNPKNENLKKGLATSYSTLGEIYQAQSIYHTSLSYYTQSNYLAEELYRDNPKNESLKQNLAITYSQLGGLYQAIGNFDTAIVYFVKRLKLGEELYNSNPKSIELLSGLGVAYSNLGSALESLQRTEDAIPYFNQASVIFLELYDKTGLEKYKKMSQNVEDEIELINALMNQEMQQLPELIYRVESASDSKEKVYYQQKVVDLWQSLLDTMPDNVSLRISTANAYGNLAFYRLLNSEFAAAERAARTRIDLVGPDDVCSLLAMALLYQGRFDEAVAIYKKYKGKPYGKKRNWTKIFLSDMDALETAGIIHEDVKKVRKLLGDK